MSEFHDWHQRLQVERTIQSLRKNNFDVRFVPKTLDAAAEVFTMIPDGSTVGVGGSMTLHQIGFFEEAGKHNITFMNPPSLQVTPEEAVKLRRTVLLADVFLASSNAVTEDGKLYNVDATGNRVAAMTFGPNKVILVCGTNKIVKDIAEAGRRVRQWVAPMNAKRLGFKTPCAETGVCVDCSSPQRICNIYSVLAKKPLRTDLTVVLVGEHLGF